MIANDSEIMLRQAARKADKTGMSVCSRFISSSEESIARHAANEAQVSVSFFGGWQNAERVQACFHQPCDEPEFSLQWLKVTWHEKFAQCSHRMLLGSLMSLGIDRSYFGDLLVYNSHGLLCALPEVASRLNDEWTKAGNVPIHVELLEGAPEIREPKGNLSSGTVASMRLDCILAFGMDTSRAKAAESIKAGKVQVDHLEETRTDRVLSEGQLLSVAGFGRIRLKEIGTVTRKDRQRVTVEIFHNDK